MSLAKALTSIFYRGNMKLMKLIISMVLIILSANMVAAVELGESEKLAKDYQRNGGDLIFVQPLNPDGTYDLGAYNGHWMNMGWNKEIGVYYYDPSEKAYYWSSHSVELYFESLWNKEVAVFNYNKGEVPFRSFLHRQTSFCLSTSKFAAFPSSTNCLVSNPVGCMLSLRFFCTTKPLWVWSVTLGSLE